VGQTRRLKGYGDRRNCALALLRLSSDFFTGSVKGVVFGWIFPVSSFEDSCRSPECTEKEIPIQARQYVLFHPSSAVAGAFSGNGASRQTNSCRELAPISTPDAMGVSRIAQPIQSSLIWTEV
jgi:hypothetical protein